MTVAHQVDRPRSAPRDPHRVLHLSASAPQDLVMEVYWHLTQKYRQANDPTGQADHQQLNEAYAAIVEGSRSRGAEPSGAPDLDEGRARRGGRRWFWRRRNIESSDPERNSYELLRLTADAPPDVVELAYHFWRLHVRAQGDGAIELTPEQLLDAFEVIRDGTGDSSERPSMDSPAAELTMPEAARSENEYPIQGTATERASARATDVESETNLVSVETDASPGVPSRAAQYVATLIVASGKYLWRLTKRVSVSVARSIGRAVGSAWRGFRSWLGRRAIDPFYEQERGKYDPEKQANKKPARAPNPEPQYNSFDERFTKLAASRLQAGPPAGSQMKKSDAGFAPAAEHARPEAAIGAGATHLATEPNAMLVEESTQGARAIELFGDRSTTIGTHPGCDLKLPADSSKQRSVAARVWSRKGQFILHVLETTPTILVNGKTVDWALLENGDHIEIDSTAFRFETQER